MRNSDSTDWIEQHFEVHGGFPRPDWAAIARHIEGNTDESRRNEIWLTASRIWLDKITEVLGDGYWLGESENFQVVTNESDHYAENLSRFLENMLSRVLEALDGIARD
jgi:hypothetical protein